MESLGGLLFPLLILLLFIPIFLSGRKQRRQMQEMQQLQSALEVGDVVTTTSGLRGTVVDASYEDTVDLEIADDVVTTWREKVADVDAVDDLAAEHPADDVASTPSGTTPAGTVVADRTGSRTDVDGTPGTVVEPPLDTPSDANGSHRPS